MIVSCNEVTTDILNKQRFSNVLESSSDFIAAVDKDLKYLFFNEAHQNEFSRLFNANFETGSHVLGKLEKFPEENLI